MGIFYGYPITWITSRQPNPIGRSSFQSYVATFHIHAPMVARYDNTHILRILRIERGGRVQTCLRVRRCCACGDRRLNIASGISIPASHVSLGSLYTLRVGSHASTPVNCCAPHIFLAAFQVPHMQSWRYSRTTYQSLRPFHAISPLRDVGLCILTEFACNPISQPLH